MDFDQILGLEHIKHHLVNSIENRRVAHAQLFVGEHGYGTLPMALAFAKQLIEKSQKRQQNIKVLEHPDVHFVYPINSVPKSTKNLSAKIYFHNGEHLSMIILMEIYLIGICILALKRNKV